MLDKVGQGEAMKKELAKLPFSSVKYCTLKPSDTKYRSWAPDAKVEP